MTFLSSAFPFNFNNMTQSHLTWRAAYWMQNHLKDDSAFWMGHILTIVHHNRPIITLYNWPSGFRRQFAMDKTGHTFRTYHTHACHGCPAERRLQRSRSLFLQSPPPRCSSHANVTGLCSQHYQVPSSLLPGPTRPQEAVRIPVEGHLSTGSDIQGTSREPQFHLSIQKWPSSALASPPFPI